MDKSRGSCCRSAVHCECMQISVALKDSFFLCLLNCKVVPMFYNAIVMIWHLCTFQVRIRVTVRAQPFTSEVRRSSLRVWIKCIQLHMTGNTNPVFISRQLHIYEAQKRNNNWSASHYIRRTCGYIRDPDFLHSK